MNRNLLKFAAWTSLLCLLPLLAGAVLWDRLPEQMVNHWNMQGQADGWGDRWAVVTSLPLLMFVFHWIMVALLHLDRRAVNQNPKLTRVVLLILPVMTNVLSVILYSTALGVELDGAADAETIGMAAMGGIFLFTGNYLPKCRRNTTMGIRVPWTVYNEENWNRTHRFGGKVFFFGGLFLLAAAVLPLDLGISALASVAVAVALLPIGYSYLLYRKSKAAGSWTEMPLSEVPHWVRRSMKAVTAAVLVLAVWICFTGNITYGFQEDSLTIHSSFREDLTVAYERIASVELREDMEGGSRVWGVSNFRMNCGTFEHEELGTYTRYTYRSCPSVIVLRNADAVLVLNAKTEAETAELYQELQNRMEP